MSYNTNAVKTMDLEREIRKILIDERMTITDLSKKLNTSRQNLTSKLKTNKEMKVSTLESILNELGYELKIEFIKKND